MASQITSVCVAAHLSTCIYVCLRQQLPLSPATVTCKLLLLYNYVIASEQQQFTVSLTDTV